MLRALPRETRLGAEYITYAEIKLNRIRRTAFPDWGRVCHAPTLNHGQFMRQPGLRKLIFAVIALLFSCSPRKLRLIVSLKQVIKCFMKHEKDQ